jgi:hypothetical protein
MVSKRQKNMSKDSFTKLDPFMFIFHRGANTIISLKEKTHVWEEFSTLCNSIPVARPMSWGVEGDINWLQDGDQMLFYFFHTYNLGNCIKTAGELVKKEKTGEIVLLKDLLANDRLQPYYIIEIKSGVGPEYQALERLLRMISDLGFSARVWYDSYSPKILSRIKEIQGDSMTSLHTSLLFKDCVLLTRPGRGIATSLFNISLKKLRAVPQADIITTFIRPTISGSARLREKINSFDKKTVFGALFSPANLRNAWRSGASGGYIRFDLSSLSPDQISAL